MKHVKRTAKNINLSNYHVYIFLVTLRCTTFPNLSVNLLAVRSQM